MGPDGFTNTVQHGIALDELKVATYINSPLIFVELGVDLWSVMESSKFSNHSIYHYVFYCVFIWIGASDTNKRCIQCQF